jgi:hypothetical protein
MQYKVFDRDASGDYIILNMEDRDCLMITGHEDGDVTNVRIAADDVPNIINALSNWYQLNNTSHPPYTIGLGDK